MVISFSLAIYNIYALNGDLTVTGPIRYGYFHRIPDPECLTCFFWCHRWPHPWIPIPRLAQFPTLFAKRERKHRPFSIVAVPIFLRKILVEFPPYPYCFLFSSCLLQSACKLLPLSAHSSAFKMLRRTYGFVYLLLVALQAWGQAIITVRKTTLFCWTLLLLFFSRKDRSRRYGFVFRTCRCRS